MRLRLLPLCLAAAAAAFVGCSLLLDFDPANRPCDATGGCLAGFFCQDDVCVPEPTCGPCSPDERCAPSGRCVVDDCSVRACPAGFQCLESTDGSRCEEAVAPLLGHACNADAECGGTDGGASFVCLRGAVELAESGALSPGRCVELCGAADACATPGATCQTLPLGLGAGSTKLCLTERLVTPCTSDERCRDDRLVCTLFNHPTTGPATLCDTPLPGGASDGEACVNVAAEGSELCANGLCVPQTPESGVPATCTTPCEEGSCSVGTCMLAPFRVQGALRQVPLCIEAATRCTDCTDAANVCGADAPRCALTSAEVGARAHCLAECTPGATACPTGQTCTTVAAGYSVCIGGCP